MGSVNLSEQVANKDIVYDEKQLKDRNKREEHYEKLKKFDSKFMKLVNDGFVGRKEEDNMLYVVPSKKNGGKDTIFLTKSKSSWITIEWIPESLSIYARKHYQEMFDLRPNKRGKIVMFNKEFTSYRWHQSYLKTPKYDPQIFTKKQSYMYSGKESYRGLSLPNEFQVFLNFINSNLNSNGEDKYNQVIANWYDDGNDYIAAHSDCQIGMKQNAAISIITFNQYHDSFRELRFTAKNLKETENDNIYKHIKIATLHGTLITMHGDIQKKFMHKIPKAQSVASSRISLSFRKF